MPPPSKEIHFAIACLERIIQTYESTNNDQEELRKHFIDYYREMLDNKKHFTQELAKHQKEVKAITKKLEYYNTLCEQLTPAHAKLSRAESDAADAVDDTTNSDTASTVHVTTESLSDDANIQLDQLAEKYLSMIKPKITPTVAMLSQAFEISERIIERIGLKNIASRALELCTDRIITDHKIKLFADFHDTNGRYPNRKEMEELKIISGPELRKLSPVYKTVRGNNAKALPLYIHEYISSKISDGDTPIEEPTEEPTEDNTVEDTPTVEDNEPLIELPKKRTSSKSKTSYKLVLLIKSVISPSFKLFRS